MEVVRDDKPARQRDRSVYDVFHHLPWNGCLHCSRWPIEAAHLLRGIQREEVLEALIPLCRHCHGAFDTGNTHYDDSGLIVLPQSVRWTVAKWLRSEAGEDAAAYLIRVRGAFGAEDYVQKLEAA